MAMKTLIYMCYRQRRCIPENGRKTFLSSSMCQSYTFPLDMAADKVNLVPTTTQSVQQSRAKQTRADNHGNSCEIVDYVSEIGRGLVQFKALFEGAPE